MRSLNINILLLIITLSLNSAHQSIIKDQSTPAWDILIFSQSWPETKCKYWKQEDSSHHCRFPSTKNRWTVHGIWPTKLGTKSPSYCNDTLVFDPQKIKSIEEDLEQAWINVFIGNPTYEFWAHEWNKHGTCGVSINDLNSQLKYFLKGIYWNKKYVLSDMLSSFKVIPSNVKELSPEALSYAVMSHTSKQPTIVCWWKDGVQYLDELRICFDKQLKVIDCPYLLYRTCDRSEGIIYPIWSYN